MRVGVIGGGAAGLWTTWLLEADHDVVLFESEPRFGGHCHTVPVELDGRTWAVDTGIHFFSPLLQPTFVELLDAIGAQYIEYTPSNTFHDRRTGWTVAMPPFGSLRRMAGLLAPRGVRAMMQLNDAIARAVPLVEQGTEVDNDLTFGSWVAEQRISPAFAEAMLYPMLGSFWGVPPDVVRTYSARNVMSYLVLIRPAGVTPRPMLSMVGGMQAYVDRLVADMARADLRCGVPVRGLVAADGGGYVVEHAGGETAVDAVVFATNAEIASRLLRGLEGTEDVRRALDRVEYFETRIAVHGDVRFMPQKRHHWSSVNVAFDGRCAAITDWAESNRAVDVFRSWVIDPPHAIEPLYAEVKWRHPHPDPRYFRCQRELRPLQGRDGLWFTGMYVEHFDNHEGVVRSAVSVARALAPGSARLKVIDG